MRVLLSGLTWRSGANVSLVALTVLGVDSIVREQARMQSHGSSLLKGRSPPMGITRQRLHMDLFLALLASGCAVLVTVVPMPAYLAPALVPPAQVVALTWGVVRALVLDRTLRQWRSWRTNVPWTMTPRALEAYHE